MKKTLAILLSLALVVCMIPATAFAGDVSESVILDGTSYTVSFDKDTFGYNATKQVPTVRLSGTPTSAITYVYKNADTGIETDPIEAGRYDVYAKTVNNPTEVKVGSFVINKVTLARADIKEKQTIDSTAFSAITADSVTEETLKRFFKVVLNNYDIDPKNYNLSVTEKAENSVRITATATAEGSLADSTTAKTFNTVTSLSGATITAKTDSTDFMYGTLKPVLTVVKDGRTLNNGVDYTVEIIGNINVGAEVKAVVTGIGTYTGEASETFVIKKFNLSKATYEPSTITVAKGATDLSFTVKAGTRTLTRNVDYTLGAFSTNTSGSVKISGKGDNYEGDLSIPFTVIDSDSKDIALSKLSMPTLTYNGLAQSSTPTLKIGTKEVSRNCYTIKYRKHGTSTFSLSYPTDAGKYDIEVDLTSYGKSAGYYNGTAGTYTTKVFDSALTIKPLDISSSSITASYTGSPANNPVKLTLGSKTLVAGTDYEVDPYSASKTYYTVKGKGNFTGTRTVYTSTKNISYCTATFSDNRSSVSYGQKYYPKVTVYDGSKKLSEGTDYKLTYKNSKKQEVSYCQDTGSYTVVITGINAYTGTKELTFTITGTDISKYTVILKYASVNATGSAQTPEIVSVKYGSNSSLTANDYTVSYQDSNGKTVEAKNLIAPGTYKVIVTGRNGYSGSTSTTFRIVGLTQTVTVEKDSYKVYPTSDFFKIAAKASGEYSGFTYQSSNPAVASVSSTGYVTPKKVGRAVITVTAVGKNKYESASKTVEVKVYPNKAKISKKPWTDGKKAQMKVRWNYQDGVTKYQVRYSRDKNFKSGTYLTKTVKAHGKDYTTQSTTLSNLKRGYTYYIKVRAVYTDPVTGDNYYGSWSPWRSARTR